MSTRRLRPRVAADPMLAVGWIFADLLLGLVILLLASQVVVPKRSVAEQPPKPSPTVKTLATMEKKPVNVIIPVKARGLAQGDPAAIRSFERSLAIRTESLNEEGREAAMVLVWGLSPDLNRGTAIAEEAAKHLNTGTGDLFKKANGRPLWKGQAEGRVKLEIYLYEQERR